MYLLADTTKVESEDSLKNQVGVHVDFTTKGDLREALHLRDWARERSTSLRVGYRRLRSWDGEREDVSERRAVLELTVRAELPRKLRLAHRFGFDHRDLSGKSAQRYRYRLNVERDVTVGQTVLVPYVQAEVGYDSRYSAWNRQTYTLGSEIELTAHFRLEPYVAIEKDTQPDTTYTDRIGLVAKFYW